MRQLFWTEKFGFRRGWAHENKWPIEGAMRHSVDDTYRSKSYD